MGPVSRSVEVLEELLKTGMSVARFNFSHGSHDYHQVSHDVKWIRNAWEILTQYQQTWKRSNLLGSACQNQRDLVAGTSYFQHRLQETLDALRQAMQNTKIMCAVMLDTKASSHVLRLIVHDVGQWKYRSLAYPNKHHQPEEEYAAVQCKGCINERSFSVLPPKSLATLSPTRMAGVLKESGSPDDAPKSCTASPKVSPAQQLAHHKDELRGGMQGPEIRTGFLKDAKPIQLITGKEITITTDYEAKGDSETIAVRCDSTATQSTFASCSASNCPLTMQSWQIQRQRHMSCSPVAWLDWARSDTEDLQLQEAAGGHEGGDADPVRRRVHCAGGGIEQPQCWDCAGAMYEQRNPWVSPYAPVSLPSLRPCLATHLTHRGTRVFPHISRGLNASGSYGIGGLLEAGMKIQLQRRRQSPEV